MVHSGHSYTFYTKDGVDSIKFHKAHAVVIRTVDWRDIDNNPSINRNCLFVMGFAHQLSIRMFGGKIEGDHFNFQYPCGVYND